MSLIWKQSVDLFHIWEGQRYQGEGCRISEALKYPFFFQTIHNAFPTMQYNNNNNTKQNTLIQAFTLSFQHKASQEGTEG